MHSTSSEESEGDVLSATRVLRNSRSENDSREEERRVWMQWEGWSNGVRGKENGYRGILGATFATLGSQTLGNDDPIVPIVGGICPATRQTSRRGRTGGASARTHASSRLERPALHHASSAWSELREIDTPPLPSPLHLYFLPPRHVHAPAPDHAAGHGRRAREGAGGRGVLKEGNFRRAATRGTRARPLSHRSRARRRSDRRLQCRGSIREAPAMTERARERGKLPVSLSSPSFPPSLLLLI